jgi:RNA polymerase sigma-70 factor (ECF subfamily)
MRESTDEQLIRAVQQGCEVSFGELVRRYQQAVYRVCYRVLGDRDEARDVAQEVFLKVFRILPQWRFEAKLFTWLYRTSLNLARGVLRRRGRFQYRDWAKEDEPDTESPQVRTTLDRAQRDQAISQALFSLPDRQQQVVVLRIYERLSVQETAEIMQCKEGTVKALLFQALQRLATVIQPEEGNDAMCS